MAYYQTNELYHYGVIGMKWGVRKDPREAFSKGVRKLEKLEKKNTKYQAKVKSSSLAKAAKYHAKATRLKAKSNKYALKSAKVKRKATRWIMPMNPDKAAAKAQKYDFKSIRYDARSAKLENKASKLTSKVAKNQAKADKYDRKGRKFYSQMEKTFADVPTKSLNSDDLKKYKAYANKYANGYSKVM